MKYILKGRILMKRFKNLDSILELTLPWPPSVNHYWKMYAKGKQVRMYIGEPGRKFRKDVKELVKPHLEHCERFFKKPSRLALLIEVRQPDKRRRDLDNLGKAILDALQHAGAYCDDCQIDKLLFKRHHEEVFKPGCVKIHLYNYEEV